MESMSQGQKFWSDNFFLGVATVIAGVFNMLYSVVLAHALGPRDYGRIATLNNLVGVFLLPLPLIGLLAIRLGKRTQRRGLSYSVLGLGLGMFVASVLLSATVGRVFHLPRTLIVLYTASVVPNFGYALYIGFLERARRYRIVGALLVVSSGLGVAVVTTAVTIGRGFPLLWAGFLQGALVIGMWLLARGQSQKLPDVSAAPLVPQIMVTTIGIGTLQALWGMGDSLLAKANLSSLSAGLYTGIATIGQALPFIVSSVATVMLTAILDDPQHSRRYLGRTMVITGLLAAGFLAVVYGGPTVVVTVFLGTHFRSIAPLLAQYGLAMSALSFVLILTTYGVAIGDWWSVVPAAFGTILWITWMLGSYRIGSLVQRTLWSMLLTLLGVVVARGLAGRRSKVHRP